jgi:hypothetical protein
MDDTISNSAKFALRLPVSTRQLASELARLDGISLNQFITIAIAEKIVRLELESGPGESDQPGVLPSGGGHPSSPMAERLN